MRTSNATLMLCVLALTASVQWVQSGDLAANNVTVEGDLQLHAPANPFNVAVRYRLNDTGTQTQLFSDSDRTSGSWWWRSYQTPSQSKPLMTLDGGTGLNSSLWLYDDSDVAADIRLAAKGDSYFKGGRLGVGTDTPTEKLEVAGTVKTSGLQLTTAPAAGRVLTSDANGVGTWQDIPAGGGGGGAPSGPAGGDLTGDYPNPGLAVQATSLSKVSGGAMVSQNGNIGIGTPTPNSTLHVEGSVHVSKILRLAPSARPTVAERQRGDIYFDGISLWIFNGFIWRRILLQ